MIDLTVVPERYQNNYEFMAMYAIREARIPIVNVKQIQLLQDYLSQNLITFIDIDTIKRIIS